MVMTSKQTIKHPLKCVSNLGPHDISGKRVLVRVDFNVPLSNGNIMDDTRINAALPTITHLLCQNAIVILISHLGRPKGKRDSALTLQPVANRLSELLGQPVALAPGCRGDAVTQLVMGAASQDVILLENVRFEPGEEANDPQLAKDIASLGELFVQDSFGSAHRAHATTVGIPEYIPSVAGQLLNKEIEMLSAVVNSPKRPVVAIIGGSKVSSKLHVLESLLNQVDTLIVGGAMVYTFLKVQGIEVGRSRYEPSQYDMAAQFLSKIHQSSTRVLFPVDHCVVTDIDNPESQQIVETHQIPETCMGVDIGPKTISQIEDALADAATILWNGPLGIFEIDAFAVGTKAIAAALANSNAMTIIGGGDSAAAIEKAGLTNQMTFISTGGGASLAYISNQSLPGIDVLVD